MRRKQLRVVRYCIALGLITVLTLVGVACSSTSTTAPASTSSTTASAGNAVAIVSWAFSPNVITVKVGTTVTWTNEDPVTHTVTSEGGTFDSGNLDPKATFSYTFNSAGTFAYHSTKEEFFMKGKVVVQ